MIRETRFVIEECPHCKRPDWRHEKPYSLYTEEEQTEYFGEIVDILHSPKNSEKCRVRLGADIGSAIKEAKEISASLQKEVSFCFNNLTVIVNMFSDEQEVYRRFIKNKQK